MTQQTFHSQTATFLAKLVTSFPGDLTSGEMQKCINDPGGLRDAIHKWLRPPLAVQVPVERTPLASVVLNTITVLPNLTLAERIALGKYDWKNSDIAESRFPHNIATIGEWEYDLYHHNLSISSEDAKSSAEVDGWVVAEAEHLLAFGAAFPDVQRKFPVTALGSVCAVNGDRCVLVLWDGHGRRDLYLHRWDGTWSPYCRFLRVRKVQPSVA